MRRSLLMCPCAVVLVLAGVSGCTETALNTTISPSVSPVAGVYGAVSRASLILPTGDLRDLLASQGHAPGFIHGDWEFSRNNPYLSVRSAPVFGPEQFYEIVEYDAQWESNGIPRSSSRVERWSVRRGRAWK